MYMLRIIACFCLGMAGSCCPLWGQTIQWHHPLEQGFQVFEGQAQSEGLAQPYDRLPAAMESKLRTPVWNLSRHAAGLKLRFRTDATEIIVRYQVGQERLEMDHMPATGVSGVDLYRLTEGGAWLWCRGGRTFQDTLRYTFGGLAYEKGPETYHLYLPLYNSVTWLEIGIPDSADFAFLPARTALPVLTYGTSIMHGACASRPGMAWTAILERQLGRPLINLGFSGNGMMEAPILDLMGKKEAAIYVLDCLPNLWRLVENDPDEAYRRLVEGVTQLRAARPETPILMVEHAGYTDGEVVPDRKRLYQQANDLNRKAFDALQQAGITGLHYLSHQEIHLSNDAMVDGTHPNDLGMFQYAQAYAIKVRAVLGE